MATLIGDGNPNIIDGTDAADVIVSLDGNDTVSGGAGVARSMSRTGRPSTASRTQPPTKRASMPWAESAASTASVAGAVIHG